MLRRKGCCCMHGFIFGSNCLTVVDEISPRRLILSGLRVLKMVRGKECRSVGVACWPVDPMFGLPEAFESGWGRVGLGTRVPSSVRICEAAVSSVFWISRVSCFGPLALAHLDFGVARSLVCWTIV